MALGFGLGLPTHTPKVYAPFTPDQVALLRRWQATSIAEHMRCPHHGNVRRESSDLVPGESGWSCTFWTPDYPDLVCSYTVGWAYEGMLDEDSIQILEEMSVEVVHVSFNDDSNESLDVFSSYDLIVAFHDEVDLDWEELAERRALDERRGLVITQSTVLEDLLSDAIVRLERPDNPESRHRELDQWMIGRRLNRVELLLRDSAVPEAGTFPIEELWAVVRRRNELAHGDLKRIVGQAFPRSDGPGKTRRVEWLLVDRRSRESTLITTAGLREDLYAAIGAYTELLRWVNNLG